MLALVWGEREKRVLWREQMSLRFDIIAKQRAESRKGPKGKREHWKKKENRRVGWSNLLLLCCLFHLERGENDWLRPQLFRIATNKVAFERRAHPVFRDWWRGIATMQETWECSTDEPDGHLICDLQSCSSVSCLLSCYNPHCHVCGHQESTASIYAVWLPLDCSSKGSDVT